MTLHFVSDNKGNTIAVQIPIEEWQQLKNKYGINTEGELPQWQQKLIDERLQAIEENPNRLRPLEELLAELDKEEKDGL